MSHTATKEATIQITDGPSKFDLIVAFSDRFGTGFGADQRYVRFTTDRIIPGNRKGEVRLYISGLEYESGGGHSWLFRGYIAPGSSLELGDDNNHQISGYFNTRSRVGWLKLGW